MLQCTLASCQYNSKCRAKIFPGKTPGIAGSDTGLVTAGDGQKPAAAGRFAGKIYNENCKDCLVPPSSRLAAPLQKHQKYSP
jgi:hypothetical protein